MKKDDVGLLLSGEPGFIGQLFKKSEIYTKFPK